MLTCIYHPIDKFRVVEDDEADRLKATGVWFDSPVKAKEYRSKVEEEIKTEGACDKKKRPGSKDKLGDKLI